MFFPSSAEAFPIFGLRLGQEIHNRYFGAKRFRRSDSEVLGLTVDGNTGVLSDPTPSSLLLSYLT